MFPGPVEWFALAFGSRRFAAAWNGFVPSDIPQGVPAFSRHGEAGPPLVQFGK